MMQSLSSRLLVTASIVLFIFLGITGVILDRAFVISQKKAVRERLKLHTYAILSVTEEMAGQLYIPKFLQESRFNQRKSVLFAIVTDEQGREIWRSISSRNKRLDYGRQAKQGQWIYGSSVVEALPFGESANEQIDEATKKRRQQKVFVSNYGVSWFNAKDKQVYNISVMESTELYTKEIQAYRLSLVSTLLIVSVILLLLQRLIFVWGLSPLRGLAKDLEEIDLGKTESLSGEYPKELQPMTVNMNLLIANERRQREKYRATLADLSHSLKTPLAVLQGLESEVKLSSPPMATEQLLERLDKQVKRMTAIVNYQLQRAAPAGESISITASPVAEELTTIVDALNKVYLDKQVHHDMQVDPQLIFYGDENDLIEILGNLLDNAFKQCQSQLKVQVLPLNNPRVAPTDIWESRREPKKTGIEILVEDDGPGVPREKREIILKRGVRLDSLTEGQGIGLSVVVDIIASYQGTIDIEDSHLGGALFRVKLPVPEKYTQSV